MLYSYPIILFPKLKTFIRLERFKKSKIQNGQYFWQGVYIKSEARAGNDPDYTIYIFGWVYSAEDPVITHSDNTISDLDTMFTVEFCNNIRPVLQVLAYNGELHS